MAYSKTTWTNGSGNAINATNLNHIETGIDEAHSDLSTHEGTSNPHPGSASSASNSDITELTGLITDLSISQGGTGQSTAQAAIDALSSVSVATNEHVLTKDTATGNAIFKIATGGGVVTSVFTRTGDVVAVSDDYTWAQIDKTTSDLADITTKSHTSLTDKGTTTHADLDTDHTKLTGIDAGADVTADNAPQTHSMATHTDEGALATLNTVDTAQVDNDSITYAKMQNVVADERILGNITAVDSPVAELTKAQVLNMLSVEDGATADQTGADIKTAYEGEADTNEFSDAEKTKLGTVDTNADVTGSNAPQAHTTSHTDGSDDIQSATNAQKGVATAAHIQAIEANTSKVTNATHSGEVTGSGALTITADAVTYAKMQNVVNNDRLLGRVSGADGVVEEITKSQTLSLLNVEDGATADQTGAEIKTVYEAEVNTNAFTDADHSKLDGIATGANCIINSDTYVGNGTANRAVAHGLGTIPKMVNISSEGVVVARRIIIKPGLIEYGSATSEASYAVTAADATNFYVGNSAEYNKSSNNNTANYTWVAIG